MVAALTGRPVYQPWIVSQPAAAGAFMVGWSSTPSATTCRHRSCAKPMAEDTISAQDGMSTFARSQVALAEAVRVLARGGTYAMTDVLLDRTRAAPGVVAAVDQLTRAQTVPEYAALLDGAGLQW